MKGIILAGGTGSRLDPLTRVTNKHLLPVWKKPMIYYPIQTLKSMGIEDVLVVSGREHCGHILSLLGSGRQFGVTFSYEIQDEAGGIAQALSLAEDFADDRSIAVILGDNIFTGAFDASDFKWGARLFLKETEEAHRFGVAEIVDGKIAGIEEKPAQPKSNLAVTGLYLYDARVFDFIKTLKPSDRNELEITDVNNRYVKAGEASYSMVDGDWTDAGTFESLYRAGQIIRNLELDVEHEIARCNR